VERLRQLGSDSDFRVQPIADINASWDFASKERILMKFDTGSDWPLGIIVLIVCAPIIAVLGYLLWTSQVNALHYPAEHQVALRRELRFLVPLFIAAPIALWRCIQRRRGVLPADEDDEPDRRYSDRDF
jgi:hypothetical protein